MPVVVFASSKGGSGKGTSAVLLTTELVRQGTTATLISRSLRTNPVVVRHILKSMEQYGLIEIRCRVSLTGCGKRPC